MRRRSQQPWLLGFGLWICLLPPTAQAEHWHRSRTKPGPFFSSVGPQQTAWGASPTFALAPPLAPPQAPAPPPTTGASPSAAPDPPGGLDLWAVATEALRRQGHLALVTLVLLGVLGYLLSQAQNLESALRLLGRFFGRGRPSGEDTSSPTTIQGGGLGNTTMSGPQAGRDIIINNHYAAPITAPPLRSALISSKRVGQTSLAE